MQGQSAAVPYENIVIHKTSNTSIAIKPKTFGGQSNALPLH
jgi:hypothetical protein